MMSKDRLFHVSLVILAVWLASLTGCDILNPTVQAPHSITIDPSSGTMVAFTTQRFTAKGYNRDGDEIFFTPTSWPVYPAEFGRVVSYGRDDGGRPFADLYPTAATTGELYCFYSDVQGYAVITALATVASISVTAEAYLIRNNRALWFTAIAKDPGGHIINLITPSWEIVGGIGTFTGFAGNQALFLSDSTFLGKGTIEAILGGVVGSREVEISTEGF